jgi:hypothetical protein
MSEGHPDPEEEGQHIMSAERKSIGDALNRILAGANTPKASPRARQSGAAVPRSRQGRRGLLTYHDPMTIRQLQELALEQDTSQQKLVAEALNLLFVKYRMPPIA